MREILSVFLWVTAVISGALGIGKLIGWAWAFSQPTQALVLIGLAFVAATVGEKVDP